MFQWGKLAAESRMAGNPTAWEDLDEERWEDGEVRVENLY